MSVFIIGFVCEYLQPYGITTKILISDKVCPHPGEKKQNKRQHTSDF